MPNMHLDFAFPEQCTGCQIYVPLLVGLFFIAPPPGCCLVFLYTPDLTPCLRHQALLSSIASTRLPQLLLALQTPYDYESIISSSFLGFQWIYIWINYCMFSVYLKFVPRWESSRAFYHSQLFQTCTSVATVWLYELTFTIEWLPFMFCPTAIFQHTFRFWFQTWKVSLSPANFCSLLVILCHFKFYMLELRFCSLAQGFQSLSDFVEHLATNVDIAFPVIHGKFGEDGGIQVCGY